MNSTSLATLPPICRSFGRKFSERGKQGQILAGDAEGLLWERCSDFVQIVIAWAGNAQFLALAKTSNL